MKNAFRPSCCVLAATFLAIALGCGPTFVVVKGQVTKGGKPLELRARDKVFITFYPVEKIPKVYPNTYETILDTDGTYVIDGQTRKGIPVGKYRISLGQLNKIAKDKLKGTFGPDETPIVRDVNGKGDINIDLDNPNG